MRNLIFPVPSAAHAYDAHEPAQWIWDPLVLISLFLFSAAYAVGHRRLRLRAIRNQGRAFSFYLSILSIFAAIISPIAWWSELFSSVHMVQHMILVGISAPLFVLGAPSYVMLWALPLPWRIKCASILGRVTSFRFPWYFLWQPFSLWAIFALSLWAWHHPLLYEAALGNYWIHHLQHLFFFGSAALFWRVVLDPLTRFRFNPGLGVIYLFTTSLHATLLGLFMALSPTVWYPAYAGKTGNLTTLEDQHLAGLIMWMPACMVYAIVALYIFANWLYRRELAAR
jgi:putative membrane protein